ncbi:restriction endonuclease subunit S [Citrobacter braakii]|uniref:restriction endonuclease subunit S n=1 Tax=Citrobacter braakii TaxID=57706 RepID=UPI003C2FF399|nr:restriction endonuclease subunit S [Citrobacter braakii]HCB1527772.1 restriction endonuclease subunit S [Citrobacter braakii]
MSEGKLPEGWVKSELDNILLTIIGGGTPSKAIPEYYQGDIPWMSVKDMNKHTLTDTIDHITNDAVENSSTNIIPAGTPIIATRMSLGKIVTASFDSAINQDLKALFLSSGVERNFFIHWYRSQAQLIESLGTGTTVKGIRLEVLKALSINLPPFFEQKIIAEKLDTLLAQVDSIKALLECAFNKLEMFKRVVMDFAVKGDLTKEWRNKNEINEWKITHWENILLDKKDSFRRGPFGGALKKDIFVERGYKVYEQYCPINDDCSFSRYYITEEKFHEMNKFEVHAGDFLISGAGSIGKITLVPEGCEKGIINQALLRVRINNEIYDKRFFLTLFRSPMFQKVIIENSTGSAMQNLKSVKELKQIPVPLPCLSEQHEIVRRVEQLFVYADTIEKQVNNALARVNNLTQSILAKAFRGELTAQWRAENPDLISGENSAAALLEKIKAERAASSGKKAARKKA